MESLAKGSVVPIRVIPEAATVPDEVESVTVGAMESSVTASDTEPVPPTSVKVRTFTAFGTSGALTVQAPEASAEPVRLASVPVKPITDRETTIAAFGEAEPVTVNVRAFTVAGRVETVIGTETPEEVDPVDVLPLEVEPEEVEPDEVLPEEVDPLLVEPVAEFMVEAANVKGIPGDLAVSAKWVAPLADAPAVTAAPVSEAITPSNPEATIVSVAPLAARKS
jgi:hypothetical protein